MGSIGHARESGTAPLDENQTSGTGGRAGERTEQADAAAARQRLIAAIWDCPCLVNEEFDLLIAAMQRRNCDLLETKVSLHPQSIVRNMTCTAIRAIMTQRNKSHWHAMCRRELTRDLKR
jgi:hypothetical protein